MPQKTVFITEKPSVAQQFADALGISFTRRNGYMEAQNTIVTWCVGHLVSMSYPEAYDPKYKIWSLNTIPFIPEQFRYEVIGSVSAQYKIVSSILTSPEVGTIYICTDSGREGEYIYRLVAAQAGVKDKKQLRVWIDSQTREEIIRGIREAKEDSDYDNIGAAAYLRAKEDYLMGINFSRALTLKYARGIKEYLGMEKCVIAVGRVMTCVLGIVVRREREIRAFVKTPFYRVVGTFSPLQDQDQSERFQAEWTAAEGSRYAQSPKLYKENGFLKKEDAQELIRYLEEDNTAQVLSVTRKKETKNAPLLYNLAELQNDCSRFFKISPDQTLAAAQELYEKKLTTYPRTDARVLSSAVAKEIDKNLKGVGTQQMYAPYVGEIMQSGSYSKIGSTRYTNDKAITDHYAIIPTGQGFQALHSLSPVHQHVYELIVRRFLSIFYPPAVFDKIAVAVQVRGELFQATEKTCRQRGYLDVLSYSFRSNSAGEENSDEEPSSVFPSGLRKGTKLAVQGYEIRESETTPPKRYNSGSMILTMENAGQFIEEEELREQIRGSGIGTSATRAEILKKLVTNQYLALNTKTQIYTPTQLGEMIYDTVDCSIRPLLDPKLTASWEMGLTRVADGSVSEAEYMEKLSGFVARRTNQIKSSDFGAALQMKYRQAEQFYPKKMSFSKGKGKSVRRAAKSE